MTGASQQARVYHYLDYTPRTFGDICVGQSILLSAAVKQRVYMPGDPNAGLMHVARQTVRATAINTSVLTPFDSETFVGLGDSRSFGGLLQAFRFSAVAAGTTSIEIGAEIQVDSNGSSIPETRRFHASVPVRVIQCAFRVDMGSLWSTTISGVNVFIGLRLENVRLRRIGDGTFEGEGRWSFDVTTNALRNCAVDTTSFVSELVQIQATVLDNALIVNIDFQQPVNGHVLSCHPDNAINPDELTQEIGNLFFAPDRLMITVPMEGATASMPHRLSYRSGSADGAAIVSIVPVDSR